MHFYLKVQGQITWPCVAKKGQGQINWPCAALCCTVLHCVVHAKSQPCWLHCAASRGGWQEPGSAEPGPAVAWPGRGQARGRLGRAEAWAKDRPGYKPGRCPGPPASPQAPGPGCTSRCDQGLGRSHQTGATWAPGHHLAIVRSPGGCRWLKPPTWQSKDRQVVASWPCGHVPAIQ